MHPPTISIVTPSYNQAQYLEECIESVLGQGYPNLEYVIMDGGSTDGSVEIIRKYEKHLTYWQSQPDGGQYQAITEGFRHTTGEIMAWLNSDDKYHPLALAKAACIFSNHPHIRWLTGRMSYWDADGNLDSISANLPIFSRSKNLEGNFNKPYVQQESTFWHRSLWEQSRGGLSTSFDLAGDFELWMRFFRHDSLFTADTLLGGYRYHGDQRGIAHADAYQQEARNIVVRELEVREGQILPLPPAPVSLSRGRLAAFIAENGIAPEMPSLRSCWRHYTENLIGLTNVQAREKRLELEQFFQNEIMLFGLVKPSAIALMADRLEELKELSRRIDEMNRQGEEYAAQGCYEGALVLFRKAFEIAPSCPRTAVNLVTCLWRYGEREAALNQLVPLLAAHSHDRGAVLAAAEILQCCHARQQALMVCEEYLTINPHDDDVRSIWARLAER
ncbi:glycosyltransferase family 2 protein [Geobacter sp. SVR]|uniref:glycosyltransferase family 2 protein n=1 Tax=Geobacter sp. SVR TaxID=2495594 RepID=UPI00143EF555|nr:glycosyltransferase family 2 protein [Geobacter sp. SVR]BCS55962.1 hypothetical protein GSVR_42700 [Geobacter sp. SVR]GCF84725.1 hypothetical protein GSbR_13250 [Geobacter sp. SVR]